MPYFFLTLSKRLINKLLSSKKDEQGLGTSIDLSTKEDEPEAEFKEFEPRLKYDWFHLKSYSIFQDLSRFLGGFETRLKFIKIGTLD